MGGLEVVLIGLAIVALLGVMLEEVTHISKAKITLFFGTLSWILLFIYHAPDTATVEQSLHENIAEIANLWLFLVAAMTFVAYLNKKRLIEGMMNVLLPSHLSERQLMFMTGGFSFIFSSLADNITATLVSVAMLIPLNLPVNKLLRYAVMVVFAVNSGGVALITGDVTTLMIFLAGKTAIPDLLWLSLPSLISVIALAALLSIGLNGKVTFNRNKIKVRRVDVQIAAIFLFTILMTMLGNILYHLPPVLTFLCGLSVMFLVAHFNGENDDQNPILDYIRYIEFDTLLFFLGILLLVGMLKEISALDSLLYLYQVLPVNAANFLFGILSSLVDNVPLTAALLKANITMSQADWLMLTYAVGVGGSLLVIGSAAGIVTMSKIRALTFARYAKFSLALLMCYSIGYGLVYVLTSLVIATS
ncbi:Na(+)/H(+) antiporter NhaD [Saliniradius amylolyticus]|uniref:Na(+)/H(+) antiporter NhaD n=1 Tax=Saliniradius amylolyticus TaxID=2183582 RepID=A0A2S2E6E5_9ALTE|nr:sodium:proton antiporter NhaD [Saliniradius amylolyticus]AWL13235.1 Na(+)/H(+) antiporter NhaD [Saliniradius amylolyticus]